MSPVKQHFNASQPPILQTVETVLQKQFLSENKVIWNKSLKTIKKNFTGKDGKNTFTSKPVNWSKNSQLYSQMALQTLYSISAVLKI